MALQVSCRQTTRDAIMLATIASYVALYSDDEGKMFLMFYFENPKKIFTLTRS